MQPRSARFDAAVKAGSVVDVVVSVQRTTLATGATSTVIPNVSIIGQPTVTVDESAASRRTIDLTVLDPDGTISPRSARDALSPYGNELVVATGFRYPDGTTEHVPLGVFRIRDSDADGRGAVALQCVDRSIVIQTARFETPYVIAAGTNTVTAITNLLLSRYPGLSVIADATSTTTPLTVFQEGSHDGDPWKNAQDLASSAGMEVFFDASGAAIIRRVPDATSTPPVWTYSPGADALIMGSRNRMSSADARNIAIVTGEGSGVATPVRSTVEITDPASPINPATFGRAPVFFSSPLITTQAQADAAAASLLLKEAGGTEQLEFTAAPHPAHDAGDVVSVVNTDLGLNVLVVLSRFSMPVGLNVPVDFGTRARRAAA